MAGGGLLVVILYTLSVILIGKSNRYIEHPFNMYNKFKHDVIDYSYPKKIMSYKKNFVN